MQIIYFGQGKFELKTKSVTITTGPEIKVGDFILPGDGEYEIAGIQLETSQNITTIHGEELNINYLGQRQKALSDSEIERINGSDILFVPVGGDQVFEANQALATINQVEPKIVIPMYFSQIDEFSKLVGNKIEQLDQLKIAKNQINQDQEKRVIKLSCSQSSK